MGSSYLSSNDPRVLLGVGEQDVVDKLENSLAKWCCAGVGEPHGEPRTCCNRTPFRSKSKITL